MFIKNYMVQKSDVKHCLSNMTVEQAFEQLKNYGYRSVPVLDETGKNYVGIIEKLDIYEYLFEDKGDKNASVSTLSKFKDNFICSTDNFIRIFMDKDVSKGTFLAVVNTDNEFVGIITHAQILGVLKDGFGISKGGYLMTLAVVDAKGTLERLSQLINKHTTIKGVMALDDDHLYARRITLSLPLSLEKDKLDKIRESLGNSGMRVIDCVKVDGSGTRYTSLV